MDTASIKSNSPLATLDDFIEKLIDEKQFPALTPEIREQVKNDLWERLNDTINAKVVATLKDADLDEFNKLLDTDPKMEKIQEFVEEKISDAPAFLTQILLEFRRNYLGLA